MEARSFRRKKAAPLSGKQTGTASHGKAGRQSGKSNAYCVAWNKTAEFIVKYFKKGEPILIDGKLETRQYEDKQGIKRKIYEVVVREVYFCAFKKSDEQNLIEDLDGDLPF